MTVDSFSAHRTDASLLLDPTRSAVVVVDMLNDFCKPGGKMMLPGCEKLVPPQLAVIDAARRQRAPIVWVMDGHRPNLRSDREFMKRAPHCIEGSWGARVIEELASRPDDVFVTKRRYSAFFNTDLDVTLRDLGVDQLVVFGVVTNICVRSTVHDAFFHGYAVVVPEDCCAATGAREQVSSLYDIGTHFGIVADADAVVAAFDARQPLVNRIRD